jgi:hypothetical protein
MTSSSAVAHLAEEHRRKLGLAKRVIVTPISPKIVPANVGPNPCGCGGSFHSPDVSQVTVQLCPRAFGEHLRPLDGVGTNI